ncbi:MAG: glycine cleavage system protein GcvH [Actinomycetota bacterium]|nr:glycine cleavage system protein GcvH [Actinomycetota bacterium]
MAPAYPEDRHYTEQHEWVADGGEEAGVRVGITDYAQESLGDIVYVTLPDPGTEVSAGQPLGEVESTKSVSDVYAPVTGTVVARNEELDTTPDLINSDPYGAGWMVEIRPAEPGQLDALLDASAYSQIVGTE